LGSERYGKGVRIGVELMIWGSWTEITTITYRAILKIKPASLIPEEHRNEKNQSTATLVPTKEPLLHTRNKKITW